MQKWFQIVSILHRYRDIAVKSYDYVIAKKTQTRDNLIFYTKWGPYHMAKYGRKMCVNKVKRRAGTLPEIVVFQRGACSRPPIGGTVTPALTFFIGQ